MTWIVLAVIAAVIVAFLFRNFCVFIYEAIEDYIQTKQKKQTKKVVRSTW